MTKASTVHTNGWVSVLLTQENENRAKRIRKQRDAQYRNIYAEINTDERWVGDLGEIVFKSWLKHCGITEFDWLLEDAAGKPDFIIPPNIGLGIKTVKRKVPPISGYTAQITAKHASEPIDYYFFMTYEIKIKKMWLLGAISQELFLKKSRYYAAGEHVHRNYKVREGHEIYNIEIDKLTPPLDWLSSLGFSPLTGNGS